MDLIISFFVIFLIRAVWKQVNFKNKMKQHIIVLVILSIICTAIGFKEDDCEGKQFLITIYGLANVLEPRLHENNELEILQFVVFNAKATTNPDNFLRFFNFGENK